MACIHSANRNVQEQHSHPLSHISDEHATYPTLWIIASVHVQKTIQQLLPPITLGGLTGLRSFALEGCDLENLPGYLLQTMTRLTSLSLGGTIRLFNAATLAIQIRLLSHLRHLKLQGCFQNPTKISDAEAAVSLRTLKSLPNLGKLELCITPPMFWSPADSVATVSFFRAGLPGIAVEYRMWRIDLEQC